MAGHIKSIVPQRGGLAPIDNNTAFLAHYDEHANDSIRGINHNYSSKCIQYNTTGDKEYIETTLTLPQRGTIELWYYPYSFYDYNSIFENSINADDWECWIYASGILRARAKSDAGVQYQLPSINQWYHIAVTWEIGGNTSLIVDGVSRATAAISWVDPGRLILGGKMNTKSQGKMSDVRVWNYAKTAAQISKSMHNLSSEDSAGLIARWKLDEGSGQIAYDYSSTGADAVITGGTWIEGKAVYSLVNGAVLIEEETTNLVNVEPTGWTKDNGATVVLTEDFYQGEPVYKVTLPTGSLPRIWKSFTSTGQVFSGYLYARIAPESVNSATGFYFRQTGFGTTYSSKVCSFTSEWQKFSLNNVTCAADFMFMLYQANATTPDTIFYMTMPQLEAKTFSTSFVDGARSKSQLQYPASVIKAGQYTVSCWVSLNSITPSGAHQTILEVDEAPGGVTHRFLMFVENNKIGVLNGSDTTESVAYGLTGVEANRWYYLTASFDGARLKCYVDGQLKADVASVVPVFKENAMLGIGGPNWNSLNGWVDEVRIDEVVRTAEEIQSWYYQGRNGW